jgi:hypothetical protein
MGDGNRFTIPDRTNSDFGGGHIRWSLLRSVATWVRESRRMDTLDFAGVVHLKPYAVALVVAAARRLGAAHLQVLPPADANTRDHLIRLGVPAALSADWGSAGLRASNVPLKIVTDRPAPDFSYRTAERLAVQFPGGLSAGLTARIADSIDEVVLNALAHSESPIGCVVVGQAFPANQCIEIAIVDLGMTIRGHLSRRFPHLVTDDAAIREAVEEGVTGTPPGSVNRLGDPNSGVGLSELRGFATATGGELAILSGASLVCFGGAASTQALEGHAFPGTLVNVRFNTGAGAAPPRPPGMVYS